MSELQLPTGHSPTSAEALPEVTTEALQSLLALSPDALVVIDQAGTLTFVNEQACTLFGYTSEELIEHALEILLPSRFQRNTWHIASAT